MKHILVGGKSGRKGKDYKVDKMLVYSLWYPDLRRRHVRHFTHMHYSFSLEMTALSELCPLNFFFSVYFLLLYCPFLYLISNSDHNC